MNGSLALALLAVFVMDVLSCIPNFISFFKLHSSTTGDVNLSDYLASLLLLGCGIAEILLNIFICRINGQACYIFIGCVNGRLA